MKKIVPSLFFRRPIEIQEIGRQGLEALGDERERKLRGAPFEGGGDRACRDVARSLPQELALDLNLLPGAISSPLRRTSRKRFSSGATREGSGMAAVAAAVAAVAVVGRRARSLPSPADSRLAAAVVAVVAAAVAVVGCRARSLPSPADSRLAAAVVAVVAAAVAVVGRRARSLPNPADSRLAAAVVAVVAAAVAVVGRRARSLRSLADSRLAVAAVAVVGDPPVVGASRVPPRVLLLPVPPRLALRPFARALASRRMHAPPGPVRPRVARLPAARLREFLASRFLAASVSFARLSSSSITSLSAARSSAARLSERPLGPSKELKMPRSPSRSIRAFASNFLRVMSATTLAPLETPKAQKLGDSVDKRGGEPENGTEEILHPRRPPRSIVTFGNRLQA